jgi:tRNA/tmRNA/rRNA uracil-C5-methylase (TrmA/RlmC/RlmD family)
LESIALTVDFPANGGVCVGRAQGRVVFCGHSLPGETVAAEILQGGADARFWRAEAVEVLEGRSTSRVTPPCPWFGPGQCGGCAWLHADRRAQLRLKASVLTETLERLGRVTWNVEVHPLEPATGWRTRVTLHVDDAGRAGLYRSRSHTVVAVADCLQADARLGLPELLERAWPPGSAVHVSASDAGRAVIVRGPDGESAEGPTEHIHHVKGREFRCAADGFWQSHRRAADVLSAQVLTLAGVTPGDRLLDLYAGVGLFGLVLLDQCDPASVVLVEGDRDAADFARRNAADDSRVTVLGRDVRAWARRPRAADVVVLDPPRAGAGRAVVDGIIRTGARAVVYVSCEPSTLARDLAYFGKRGYTPDHITGFDVFPGTAHIETVVRLRRS